MMLRRDFLPEEGQPGRDHVVIHDRFNSRLWVPLVLQPEQIDRNPRSVLVMARLKNGLVALGYE